MATAAALNPLAAMACLTKPHLALQIPHHYPKPVRLRPPRRRLAAAAAATADKAADDIGRLHRLVHGMPRRNDPHSSARSTGPLDAAEAEVYVRMARDKQQRSLSRMVGEGGGGGGGGEEGEEEEAAAAAAAKGSWVGHSVDPSELRPGEYVVHRKVGVAKFVDTRVERDGVHYVFLEYGDGMAKLPVKQASRLLYRYSTPEENKRARKLSKLGNRDAWEKRKMKGKLFVQKMVVNLMELYLHRIKQKRPPYPKAPAMDEFASQFLYEPTTDQKQAFIDVEKDLTERETPMDRLICGDVGFGKTEVAMRAIFIVVSAGRQALVLAPTIVLANQHYAVISERFSGFPHIKIGLHTRIQTKSEKDEQLTMVKDGGLHIIVGTHGLIGNRMVYNNLGLLVVDEEHKFGVQQKEKIASYKASVDVLNLSATPIPRTLYLALTGFRDASLISTPPAQRVAVKTYLTSYSREKVLSAINFELRRGGQVFYVLPRISGLQEVKEFLTGSLPDVPIEIAHGQQADKSLGGVMEKFERGEVKILICTNIVENGLNIPNANTIIIEHVDLFGLAQLYQLRGRVGRSGKTAFAYLLYADKSLLSKIASDRLKALEDHGDLGQGFHLAERDMIIRGFGNLFGEQQSGDVAHVGIDLFFDMLFESLSEIDEYRLVSVPYKDVQLDINITTPHLSSEYINFLDNPIELLTEAEKAAEKDIWTLVDFTENLRRRYGKEPREMELLLKKLYVRRMAADLGISCIYSSGKTVFMTTKMSKKVFTVLKESLSSDTLRKSLSFTGKEIKGELLIELPKAALLNWTFQCLADCYNVVPALVKY